VGIEQLHVLPLPLLCIARNPVAFFPWQSPYS
jgi:hypothetical protein